MKVFEYKNFTNEQNIAEKEISLNGNQSNLIRSNFDNRLLSEWTEAMENGIFKFKIDAKIPTRYLPGKYTFLAQMNSKRYTEKRQTDLKKVSLNLPFDMNKFNFTKISQNEILLRISKQVSETKNFVSDLRPKENLIIINNSPIEHGHVLILPDVNSHTNQVLTKDAISLAIEVALLSYSKEILIGFNSLNAHASVNHLHLHFYYLDQNKVILKNCLEKKMRSLSIQNITKAVKLTKYLWFLHDTYYFPGFVLQLSDFSNQSEFIDKIFAVTNYLFCNEIPHNLVMVKSISLIETDTDEVSSKSDTIRVFIWARKSSQDIPDYSLNQRKIGLAMCELAGHFILQSEEDLKELTEEWLEELSSQSQLSQNQMNSIKDDLIKIFQDNQINSIDT